MDIENICRSIKEGNSILQIASEHAVDRAKIYSLLNKNAVDINRLRLNYNYFSKIDSEDKAYWLGFIYADGCILEHKNRLFINLSIKDKEHLLMFAKTIESNIMPLVYDDRVALSIHNKKMIDDLILLGCIPKKSLILTFPNFIDKSLIHHFCRGYFDGDGCVNLANKEQKKAQLRISCVGTENFLHGMLREYGEQRKLRKTGTNKQASVFEIKGNNVATKFCNWIYQDATIYLKRKKDIFDSVMKQRSI